MVEVNKHRDRTLAHLNSRTPSVTDANCVNPDHELRGGKVVADRTGEVVPHGYLCTACARLDLDKTNPKPKKD